MTSELRENDAELLQRIKARQEAANAEREAAGVWVGRHAPVAFGAETVAAFMMTGSVGKARAALKRLTDAGHLERLATPGCIVVWQLSRRERAHG